MTNRIFNIVGWVGTVCVFLAMGIWAAGRTEFTLPAVWDQYRAYLAWAGLTCLVVYLLSQWRDIAGMSSGRQARYGGMSAASVLIVLGILVAVNYIGRQQNKRWDLTAAQQYSLSDQTYNVLAALDAPLEIIAFAQDTSLQEYRDRLAEYEYASPQVTTQFIDPDKQRTLAEQYDVQQYGTIMFNYQGRSERATTNTEQDITNGIIKVVTGQQKRVYFTQGHGEKNPETSEREGYSSTSQALVRENYLVETLVLAQSDGVPDDADVVVVAGPRTDLFPQEIEALEAYLARAGKVLLLLDPPEQVDSAAIPNLVGLAAEWGIEVQDAIVVDVSGMGRLIGTDASVPVAVSYPEHPITSRFNLMTAYPLARAVLPISGGVNARFAEGLVESSDRSWAEVDVRALLDTGEVSMDEATGDRPGPISLAAAASAAVLDEETDSGTDEEPTLPKQSRIVVFGDSDFSTNAFIGIQGNQDLFMNTVGWLSQQEDLIAIRPKELDDRRITMTASQQSNVTWMSLLMIPGVIFGAGVYHWWQRR